MCPNTCSYSPGVRTVSLLELVPFKGTMHAIKNTNTSLSTHGKEGEAEWVPWERLVVLEGYKCAMEIARGQTVPMQKNPKLPANSSVAGNQHVE